jgi:hypothetical protein
MVVGKPSWVFLMEMDNKIKKSHVLIGQIHAPSFNKKNPRLYLKWVIGLDDWKIMV